VGTRAGSPEGNIEHDTWRTTTALARFGAGSGGLRRRQSPNLIGHIERFWRSLREECTDCMAFFGEAMVRRSVLEFVRHFHSERNHQGPGNRLIEAS
jgi:hypothetical protein